MESKLSIARLLYVRFREAIPSTSLPDASTMWLLALFGRFGVAFSSSL
jgi:hypothetical protein